jgi:uncharacterized protein YkwD
MICKWLFGKKSKVDKIHHSRINNIDEWSKKERAIADFLMQLRKDAGVENLIPNEDARKEAQRRLEYLSTQSKVNHDQIGVAVYALKNKDYKAIYEILAEGHYNPESTVKAWSRSQDHFEVIVDLKHKYYGVAVKSGEKDRYCVIFAH